jgi:hypothetical protein
MADSYLIGIGGSGSKCTESFVHLCAGGYGPESASIGLVDQDQSNGNVAKTRRLITRYNFARDQIRSVDKNKVAASCQFLRTAIDFPEDGSVWCPLPGTSRTINDLFKYDSLSDELRGLMDCLYDKNSEQLLPLDEGFRGRPSLGAITVMSQATSGQSFWNNIFNAIENAKSGREVRFFLTASIFGGTGASGFPSIARRIRTKLEELGISNVHIGGALFLPYFDYDQSDNDEDNKGETTARSQEFLEQSQGALRYYEKLLERERIFDSLYVVGWDPFIKIANAGLGGNLQLNPPLIPELYAALAACDFFQSDEISDYPVFQIGRENIELVSWDDLPGVDKFEYDLREAIGQLVRFSVAYKFVYLPHLLPRAWKSVSGEEWFRKHIRGPGLDLGDENSQLVLRSVEDYSEELLTWIASMLYASSTESLKLDLVKVHQFATYDPDDGPPLAKLLPELSNQQLGAFGQLISGSESASLRKVFERMTYDDVVEDGRGLGAFFSALYASCHL